MLKKFLLLIITQKKTFQKQKFLIPNCCMSLQVQEHNFLWIEFHSTFIVILNVKFSMFSQNTNIWFSRIILRISLLIQRDNSIISLLKKLQISWKESKSLKWMKDKNIMVMLKEKVQKLKFLLSMVLELSLLMESPFLIISQILITELKLWNLWFSQKLLVNTILIL